MFTVRHDIPPLDFGAIKDRLEELLEASANFLEREWPSRYSHVDSARVIFYTRMRLVINTYASFMWLTADKPEDSRRKMLVLSTPPLVRTIFEELITLIFLFHDVPALMQSYAMTNYTELDIEIKHAKKYHEHKPEWKSYILDKETRLADLAITLGLTADQIRNPRKYIGRWPTPGGMINAVNANWKASKNVEFMEYIRSWIYRSLSGDSHLNFEGVIRRGSFYAGKELRAKFGEEEARAEGNQTFEAFKMEMVWTMLTLLLSIVSEIEGHFHFGLAARAKYLWVIFDQHSDLAKEFYKARYETMLG